MIRLIKCGFILFLLMSTINYGYSQNIKKKDSIQMLSKVKEVVKSLEYLEYAKFKKLSTNNIYCLPCYNKPPDFTKENPYEIKRKAFYDSFIKSKILKNYLAKVKKEEDVRIHKQNGVENLFIVFFRMNQKDTLAIGHEGVQLGIHLTRQNNTYLFSGLETVP